MGSFRDCPTLEQLNIYKAALGTALITLANPRQLLPGQVVDYAFSTNATVQDHFAGVVRGDGADDGWWMVDGG
jgi:hypothetical protein